MDLDATITILSEGNQPTKKLLHICADVDHMLLLHLDDMNMRGLQIWAAYYGHCEGIFDRFRVSVVSRDLAMIGYVNQGEWPHRAVPRGGAPR